MLEREIAARPGCSIGLILIDLTGFHHVNTTLGYLAGQHLMEHVVGRLEKEFRSVDVVTPVGHGQLALILPELKNQNHALLAANKIHRSIKHTELVDGTELTIRLTMGVAVYPVHANRAELTVQRADIALGKTVVGHHPVQLADPETESISNPLEMVQALENAVDENELTLYFQPQINLRSGQPFAVEALSRWTSEKLGFIPPDVFIAVAESCGLIKPLTVWSLNAAFKGMQGWHDSWPDCKVAVNLSASVLHDNEIVELVRRALSIWSVSPERLTLEITESAIMYDPDQCLTTLNALHSLGVRLSIDDFGTGYSSMSYLSKLPVDELKIDKSFVMTMATDENNAKIVRTVIDLAHNFGLMVVAEGIEDEETIHALTACKCDYAQGFFISKPVPWAEIPEWYASTAKSKVGVEKAPAPVA